MKPEYQLVIDLVRSRLTGSSVTVPAGADLAEAVELAKRHKLGPLVYDGLLQLPGVRPELLRPLEGQVHKAIFRDTQFDFVRAGITQALTAQSVKHVFLRGICLKHDYPDPALRTMSDMDVLVLAQDAPTIRKQMLAMGAQAVDGDGNHRTYVFPEGITVEFHPNLIHCASHVGTGVNPGWQYVPQDQAPGEQFMTEEGFYLNVMAHLANHFVAGGVGVRFVLDIWVCRNLRKSQPDRALVEKELERIGLLEFAKNIEALSQWWFSAEASNETLEALADYIFSSGSHGESERAMLNAVCLSPGGSSGSALWGKIFYPRQDLENRFDWVRGRPWLLPVAWLVRAWKALTGRWRLIFRWGKGTRGFSKQQIADQRDLLARFGVK